ncbi:MAG: transcription-repair coupling factor [Erysipelotrichaceae bacterium]|jgi:transcription-repair coupling factor (superfamily II helicase)|nr:transcription-repair coupling factor [Erysipelotrichaceae bacterium]
MKILEELYSHPLLPRFNENQKDVGGLSSNQLSWLLAAYFQQNPQTLFLIEPNLFQAQDLYNRLSGILENQVILYASEESLRIESIATSPELLAQRLDCLYRLQSSKPVICVSHTAAILRYLANPEVFKQNTIEVKVDQELPMNELKNLLIAAGYRLQIHVDQPLTFAMRGGIIDVFSLNYQAPLRLEFFDTQIESIRFFDIESQSTLTKIDSAVLIPANDLLMDVKEKEEVIAASRAKLNSKHHKEDSLLPENLETDLESLAAGLRFPHEYFFQCLRKEAFSVLDFAPKARCFLLDKEQMLENEKYLNQETAAFMMEMEGDGQLLGLYEQFQNLHVLLAKRKNNLKEIPNIIQDLGFITDNTFEDLYYPRQNLALMLALISRQEAKRRVQMVLKEAEMRLVIKEMIEHGIPYKVGEAVEPGIYLNHGDYPQGFRYEDFTLITANELFSLTQPKSRFANQFAHAQELEDSNQLEPGDYVVHNLHGVGRYVGLVTKTIQGVIRDYLQIAYRGDGILLVPLEQFRLIRKFVSREGVVPRLHKLGSSQWQKTKEKIQESVDDIAERLLNLYATRQQAVGYAFSPDTPLQKEFEDEFEFELTPDQKTSVEQIKRDMESSKPMDRLLCGDVGFGKTEVAMRAAFKAVADGKQVAYLCPTTILSRQHFETFLKRFMNYPVRIGIVNRFVAPAIVKRTLEQVKDGSLDILIGTHRLLGKDVVFKDLGLLIVDEEQRFGVEHKEKIKEYKNTIDVLTLSATPIPRTLQMSLIGIRQLSQLNTPPRHRMPVLTYVIEKNENFIKEVIERELARNGQVFYLYNNITNIQSVASALQKQIPLAKVCYVHGQMDREMIEEVMVRFTSNEYNVLLCTTIIETGIDIPNVNTILIDQADRFGLSQLYQIKGRVGRSDRLAYAYLMVKPRKQLSEIAAKRLEAIKEFTQLGSGYRIAMRDLTIRGAGEMLGESQSGFIDTVGIDMYIEMLQHAIALKKGEVLPEEEKPRIPLSIQGYIPEKFSNFDAEKIDLYTKIDQCKTLKNLNLLLNKTEDQFGKLPKEVLLLFEKKRLELLLAQKNIESFHENERFAQLILSSHFSQNLDAVSFFEKCSVLSPEIRLQYLQGKIIARIPKQKDWLQQLSGLLEIIRGL